MSTKRIRIAVAVCSEGHACAGVDDHCDPNDWIWDGLSGCGPECSGPGKEHLVWVSVDVPLPPKAPEVEGVVRSIEEGPGEDSPQQGEAK